MLLVPGRGLLMPEGVSQVEPAMRAAVAANLT